MSLPFFNWSRTAASNATADSTVNWQEGQAPSSVNDSGRAMMASTAAYRDDIAGAIVTGGTSTAYTVTSYQIFDTLAHMNGQVIAFTPHTTNGATVTLNVDGLGAKPLRSAPSVELIAGVLVQGTPYVALYNNSDAAWYLRNFYVNPYQVPIGGMMDYIASTAPNSAFVLPIGQAISRSTYATLFGLVGTTYGAGDGSTTFNVPDLTGRVAAMKEATATRLTAALGGVDGATLGAAGGVEYSQLSTSNLPPYTPTGTLIVGAVTFPNTDNTSTANGSGGAITTGTNAGSTLDLTGRLKPLQAASSWTGNAQGGTSAKFSIVQPMIVLNKILRVI